MSRLRGILSTLTLLSALLCSDAAATPREPEKTDPTASLQPRHREFLEEVEPLLSDEEREAFLGLPRDYQRDAFIRRFWDVRDPVPKTGRNELREQWIERLKMAGEKLGGTTGDRAQVLLLAGPPRTISQVSCDAVLPLEVWDYDGSDKVKRGFSIVFVSPGGSSRGPWRLWHPTEGLTSLMSVELRLRSTGGVKDQELLGDACSQDVLGRLGPAVDWDKLRSQLVPRPGNEWLTTFLSRSTDVPDGAPGFPARADYSYPGRFGSRTVVQGLISVPRAEVRPEHLEKASAYSFVVDGEVLYRGELFEQFRYRFLFPEGEATADTFPLVFQRFLRPGTYTLVLKVEDTGGKRFWRETRELAIPPVEAAGTAVASAPAPSAPTSPNPVAGALAEANTPDFGSDERTIRILPPPPGLITGTKRVEARTTGEGIVRVRFLLNGKPVLTKSKPPYSIEISLGDAPKIHTLQAIALGAGDEKLAEDQILLNTGPHRFSIRLVEPQPGKTYQTSLRAQAQVDLPEGELLDRVEIYLNETLLASLYQPPYIQPVILPPDPGGFSYVRAVAWLADGNSTEDVVLINAPDYGEEVDVDFVELFTTVVDRNGKLVEGLTEKDFTVIEDGVPQPVRRFELVRDLPIYAGVMIDTSSSMGERRGERLDEAIKSASHFFETILQPKDRAAVFTFNDTPSLDVRFTNQLDVLRGALTGLTAEGRTALYDSLIYALYYFGGIKGKKSIILLSDGEDSSSHYSFSEALEYARRSGVAIYAVGIGMQKDLDLRSKLQKLADETGGQSFFIASALELKKVFASVEEELRSQYLLAYQSTNQSRDDKFRVVEVKVARPGLEAKTVRGYYP